LDEQVRLSDGRRLAYAEWGPPDGEPLVFFHGTPGSRLFCPDELATNDAGVRFIAFDRAGYGRSDVAGHLIGFPQFVPDVIALLDHLGVDRAVLVGWSGGGPHALAVAALEPDRVTGVGLASSGVLNASDQSREVGRTAIGATPEVLALIDQIAADPVAGRDLARARCQWLVDDPTELVRLTEKFVPDVLSAPGTRDAMEALFIEAGRPGIEGYVTDYVTQFAAPVGFSLSDLRVPVAIWYGERDRNVPPGVSQSNAEQIPVCTLVGCPECGHFTPIAHWPEILQQLLRSGRGTPTGRA
jgi:pimeloyl-ACP methyl ester carboxylesterase